MVATMKVEIVNIETIKPSYPTPNHLKIYNISVLDQLAPSMYTRFVLVYRNANASQYDHFSQTLKNSLSETLTLFPPLAGRIKDNVSVDCNDDGVQCYETRVHSTLDPLLLHPDLDFLMCLIVGNNDVNVQTEGQLLVQINLFDCGGIALGVSFSHKLCDAATFTTFLKSWSAKAINSGQLIVPDLTVSTSLPPQKDVSIVRPLKAPPKHDLISIRLVFDGPKIAALKKKSASQSTPHPTRVEAVSALIGKCVMAASKTNNKTYSMPYIFTQTINMRKMLIPSLHETAFGNVVGTYLTYSEQSDACLDNLVDKIRKGRMDYCDSLALNIAEKTIEELVEMKIRAAEMVRGDVVETYRFTSWCRFGFYEADFGMGKPIWIGLPALPFKNATVLLDTEDGNGIEAFVTFTEKDVALFQADPLLLHYASVNPAV